MYIYIQWASVIIDTFGTSHYVTEKVFIEKGPQRVSLIERFFLLCPLLESSHILAQV